MGDPGKRERAAVVAATATAGLVIAQQVAGKAIRDALFLSHHAAADLPAVMVVSAVLAFAVVVALGRLLDRWSPPRAVPAVFAASGGLFLAEWWLAGRYPRGTAVLVYVHTAALGAALVSGFWSCINERFDPHTARRVIDRIAGGAAVGGLLGGLGAWRIGKLLSLPSMLVGLAAICFAAAIGVVAIGGSRDEPAARDDSASPASGLRALRQLPYLRHLALLVTLLALAEALIDLVFKTHASQSIHGSGSLISFFALFYTTTGVVTFAVQFGFARRALGRVGLTGTVASLPATLVIGGAIALAAPGLWTIGALRGAGAAVASSLYRSGYELLYTPLAPAFKRGTKALIDVGCDRVGGALGSGLAMLAIALAPSNATLALLGFAIAAAAAGVVVCGSLHRGYVAALADGLRRGAVALEASQVMDAVTRNTLADTAMAIDRDRLLEQLAVLRQGADVSSDGAEPAPPPITAPDVAADPLVGAIGDLRSRDPVRIRGLLERDRLAPELASFAIPLLARNDVQALVTARLSELVDRCTGQLVDALLDRQIDFAVRRRIPRVLSTGGSQRAADGLVAGLADERFEVRYRCATALHRLTRDNPKISVSPAAVFAAARREAAVGEHVWRAHRLLDASVADEAVFEAETSPRSLGRGVEHVFNLLALALDREPLKLAYRALGAADERLRGTGLEYLENVLPPEIREVLRPYLGDPRGGARPPRQRDQIVSDLMMSLGEIPRPPVSSGGR